MQYSARRPLLIAAVAFVCAVLLWSVVYADELDARRSSNSSNSFTSLIWIPATGKSGPIANSSSVLIRNRNGVWYYITTVGLLPGGAYTNWWVIFNHPEFCSPPGCGANDFPQNGGNPNVQASVLWATGRVVDANGQGTFSAHLTADGTAPGEVRFGPALLNPRAEIHLIVRSHGPAMTGDALNAQLTSVVGGCSASNPCQDQQVAQHFPAGDGE